jgi:hypothetical protein
MEGGASDAMAATGDSGPADAGGSPADAGGSPADAGGSPADAGGSPADAPAADTASGDAAKQCPSFASATVDCSRSCYGNCYGQNAGGGADPSVHIGDCFITITGGIIVYCAPYGASDPCTHCP